MTHRGVPVALIDFARFGPKEITRHSLFQCSHRGTTLIDVTGAGSDPRSRRARSQPRQIDIHVERTARGERRDSRGLEVGGGACGHPFIASTSSLSCSVFTHGL